jgi:general secretion pathway protein E
MASHERPHHFAIKLLTTEQGPYPLSAEARQWICLTADGQLYLSESHKCTAPVLLFLEQLQRDQITFTLQLVSLERISDLYSRWGPSNSQAIISYCQNQVAEIIQQAVASKASDIHMVVRERATLIKFRVHGELLLMSEYSREEGHTLCATIYQTLCDVAEPVFNPHRSQDARLMTSLLKIAELYGGRVATRPTDSGLLMVIRLLYDRGSNTLQLEDLGYLPEQVERVNHMASRRFGINILSGPTGSGKSTTLECLLKRIIARHHQKIHVLTLEDPPEYRISGAVQTPIVCDKEDDEAVNREWARAISNAMRLDPDILMCGEIRDSYSAIATFRAAMTGHGVWTTLHANDALAILTRLQDIGISHSLLGDASLMTGLINQVLVRKLCAHCKQPYHPQHTTLPLDVQERIERYCQVDQLSLRGPGCQHCQQRGIAGRMVVAEVIEPDNTLLELFLSRGKNAARQYWLNQLKGYSKNRNLITLINQGLIDPVDGEQDVCMLDHDALQAGNPDDTASPLAASALPSTSVSNAIQPFLTT